jgi:hypothetical protein
MTQNTTNRSSVLIATPMYGGMCSGEYTRSLLHAPIALMQNGVDVAFSFIFNDSLIQNARNTLAHEFLSGDYTHLMFIDADIKFNAYDILTMLGQDADIIGGVYPMKAINWEAVKKAALANMVADRLQYAGSYSVINLLADEHQEVKIDRPIEVSAIGTGFMLIKRETFGAMNPRSYVNNEGNRVSEYFYLMKDENTGRLLPEDYTFCYKAREAGKKVFAAPWVKLSHIGTHTFVGQTP